ncbi:group II intron reverse transcriptase/maturase [Candidatus Odyssella thessalonicensis]|uniref:group II intron reverse transcriptase/maturase n=1 Tax=Candidatus Odyssella thessalonicensis TaxID=84647 RepID=UPI000225AF84|nr:group II intron reverse transcriptase/maturase [Candidatus Odyssella thessalonicensis]
MTVMEGSMTGASAATSLTWDTINWQQAKEQVHRLQVRIAKATREGRYGKVKALQWILTHSFYAKALAVRRVVQNRGNRTPGVDNVVWRSAQQKMRAILSLKRHGYRTMPLKRIYIPKKKGLRPLSIPTMKCRAMQALHLLALEPVVEMTADKNAYGFRPKRSSADAIEQCFNALSHKSSASWVLEGDIRSCFDSISHKWLMEHITMDKEILRKWLGAGYFDQRAFYLTAEGTPQGGIISPTLLNATLSGLEKAVRAISQQKDKVNVCIYADDFIITGASKEVLEEKIKPVVVTFLQERGLELSQEKTRITSIYEGFDFLGFHVRKYREKLLIKPSKASTKSFLKVIRQTVKTNRSIKTEKLIQLLNPKIRGWTNYFQHVVSKKTFHKVGQHIFQVLWRWSKRKHPNKGSRWVRKKYFRSQGSQNWIFHAMITTEDGKCLPLDLYDARKVPIKRHVKIRMDATPYDPAYDKYFRQRGQRRKKHSDAGLIY